MIRDTRIVLAYEIAETMRKMKVSQVYFFPEPADARTMRYVYDILRDSEMAWTMTYETVPFLWVFTRLGDRTESAARYR